jgi:hypothetical protein
VQRNRLEADSTGGEKSAGSRFHRRREIGGKPIPQRLWLRV